MLHFKNRAIFLNISQVNGEFYGHLFYVRLLWCKMWLIPIWIIKSICNLSLNVVLFMCMKSCYVNDHSWKLILFNISHGHQNSMIYQTPGINLKFYMKSDVWFYLANLFLLTQINCSGINLNFNRRGGKEISFFISIYHHLSVNFFKRYTMIS